MAARRMSLPHERRKASLKSAELKLKVRIAEDRERLAAIKSEQKAMQPKKAAPADVVNIGRRNS